MKRRHHIAVYIISALLGLGAASAIHERAERNAFERGREQGLLECQEPSRLEKAAKWLSE